MAEPIERYIPANIEGKWQSKWAADGLYQSDIDPKKKKHYSFTMFPYTSGYFDIGHWYATAPSDVHARFKRMQGFNVLHPIGFDAFGLPAENAAIKRGIHPQTWTIDNIENMRTTTQEHRGDVRLEPRSYYLFARILQMDAMVLCSIIQEQPGLPKNVASGLVPTLQHHLGA